MAPPDSSSNDKDLEERPLEAVIDRAIDLSDGERIRFRDFLEAWGDRSYGPLFIILGFAGGTPLAAVPAAAAIVGVVIFVLAIQMAFGKSHPWAPKFILDRSVKEKTLRTVRRRADPVLGFIDNLITERLRWASNEAFRRGAAVVVALLGLVMVPLDAVPFAVAAPAWGVVLFGVAITARDGLVMLLASALALGVGYLAVSTLL